MTIWEVDDAEDGIEGLDEDGRPDPAYAAALGMLRAPLGRRALAFAVDLAVYLVLQVPYWVFTLPLLLKFQSGRLSWYLLLNHPQFTLAAVMLGVSALLSLVFVVVQLVLHGRRGVTLGKAVTGIRTVNVATLERPGFFRVLLRALVVWLSTVLVIGPVLFLLSPLFDPAKRGRGWHDMAGRTWLVDVRRGLDPYDAKRMRVARKAVTAEPVVAAAKLPSLATPSERSEQQEYRPGARVSAGVLGVARPHGEGPRPVVGLAWSEGSSLATGAGPEPATPGRPVVGGYRRAHESDHDRGPEAVPTAAPAAAGPPAAAPSPQADPAPVAGWGPPPAEQRVTTARTDHPRRGDAAVVPLPVPAAGSFGQVSAPPAPSPVAAPPPPPDPPASPAAAPGSFGRVSAPPAPTPPPPSGGASVETCTLVLDSGQRVLVDAVVVVGRNPVPPSTDPLARPHPVSDDTRSMSKTHALLRPAAGGLEVVDQGSTNGTVVVHDGQHRRAQPHQPVPAHPGDTVLLGDRVAEVVRT